MQENWYYRYIFPLLLDAGCRIKQIRQQREKIVPLATGRVLEIGIGTGLNIPHYDKSRVSKIVALDPALCMHRLARKRIENAGLEVELIGLSAEKIPLADASFDSVVMTYTLCSIPDPVPALREMRRVLAPGGRLLFCEHGRSPEEGVRRWQTRLQPQWKKLFGGCHLDRDVPALLTEAGFECRNMQAMYIPGPRLYSYNYWGEAFAS